MCPFFLNQKKRDFTRHLLLRFRYRILSEWHVLKNHMKHHDVLDILKSSHATIIQPYSGRIYRYESLNEAHIPFETWKNNNPRQL